MTSPKLCILAAVAGVLSTQAVFADPQADMAAQINSLQTQVAQLEARQAQSGKDVAATIDQVLRDAERRTSLMAEMGGAGYDNGFFIRSGNFEMRPGILFQFWSVADYRTNTSGPKADETETGYEVHLIDFSLSGTAFSKDISYNFLWRTTSDSGASMNLLDAYVTYMLSDAWGIRAGQLTANFTHEDYLGNGTQLAAERSLLDAALGGYTGRVQEVVFLYGNYNDKTPINAEISLNDGSSSKNSNYQGHFPGDPGTVDGPMGPGNHAFDFGVYGRLEWLAMGSWKDYNDFSAMGVKNNLFVLGGAVAYDQGGDGDLLGGTVDAQFKMNNGLALYGAAVIRHGDKPMTGTGDSATDWGFLLQASYLLNPAWEIFARYSYINYDHDLAAGTETEDTFHEITVGVNYFLGNNGSAGHRAKITVDLNWLPNGAPGSMTNLGYLGDSGFDNEVALRGAFQLML